MTSIRSSGRGRLALGMKLLMALDNSLVELQDGQMIDGRVFSYRLGSSSEVRAENARQNSKSLDDLGDVMARDSSACLLLTRGIFCIPRRGHIGCGARAKMFVLRSVTQLVV